MSDIRNTIGGLVGTVAKTSKDLIKNTKLSLELNSAENELKSIYIEIGKKVHEIYAYGGTLGKYFDEKYVDIQSAEAKVADVKNRMYAAKGVKICGKCSKQVEAAAEFCPKCGNNKFNEFKYEPGSDENAGKASAAENSVQAEETRQERKPEAARGKICPLCGKENGVSDKFCLSCGRMIN